MGHNQRAWRQTREGIRNKIAHDAKIQFFLRVEGSFEWEFTFVRQGSGERVLRFLVSGGDDMIWIGGMSGQDRSIEATREVTRGERVRLEENKRHRVRLAVGVAGENAEIDLKIDDTADLGRARPIKSSRATERHSTNDRSLPGIFVHSNSSTEFLDMRARLNVSNPMQFKLAGCESRAAITVVGKNSKPWMSTVF